MENLFSQIRTKVFGIIRELHRRNPLLFNLVSRLKVAEPA